MKNNNTVLVQALFGFNLLDSNFSIWKYREVLEGDTLIVLREMDLTPAARQPGVEADGGHAHASTRAARGACVRDDDYWGIYEQARREYKKTKRFKGFEILSPRALQKLWISQYDLKLLINKVETHL